jgi:hypothetical protein
MDAKRPGLGGTARRWTFSFEGAPLKLKDGATEIRFRRLE